MSGLEEFVDGNWIEVFVDTYAGVWGLGGFAMLVVSVVAMGILTWSQSVTLTVVWLLLGSGVVLPFVPPTVGYVIYLLYGLGITIGLFRVVR